MKSVASAPAKIILFGEHAVVKPYSKLGVATAVSDFRTVCSVEIKESTDPDIVGYHKLTPSESVFENENSDDLADTNFFFGAEVNPYSLLDQYMCEEIEEFLQELLESTPSFDISEIVDLFLREKNHFFSTLVRWRETFNIVEFESRSCMCVVIMYLFAVKYFSSEISSTMRVSSFEQFVEALQFTFDVQTNFPFSAGLGSSASFCVSLVTSVFSLLGVITSSGILNADDLDLVNSFSYILETVFHGTPSGLDNLICTYGGFATIQGEEQTILLLDSIPEINLLIVDTKVKRNTKDIVEKVKNRYLSDRKEMEGYFHDIGRCSEQFVQLLERSNHSYSLPYQEFRNLIDTNQQILEAIEVVGHDRLDEVVAVARDSGLSGKITGAGGGGCAIILFEKKETIEEIVEKLNSRNFDCYLSQCIGGKGVKLEFS